MDLYLGGGYILYANRVVEMRIGFLKNFFSEKYKIISYFKKKNSKTEIPLFIVISPYFMPSIAISYYIAMFINI